MLDTIRWETHVTSSFGETAQSVISEQIKNDYEIYFGMLSTRFGSPTKNWRSGTEEEFQDALSRRKNSALPEIIFLFGSPNVPADQIDGKQLALVQDFKREIGERGVLYFTFDSETTFRRLTYSSILEAARRLLLKSAKNLPDMKSSEGHGSGVDPHSAWKSLINTDAEVHASLLLEDSIDELVISKNSIVKLTKALDTFSRDLNTSIKLTRQKNNFNPNQNERAAKLSLKAFKDLRVVLLKENPVILDSILKCVVSTLRAITILKSISQYDVDHAAALTVPLSRFIESLTFASSALSGSLISSLSAEALPIPFLEIERRKLLAVTTDTKNILESSISNLRALLDHAEIRLS